MGQRSHVRISSTSRKVHSDFRPVPCLSSLQQFQYTTCGTRQHYALRASPRQNANAEQDTQKDFGQFGRRTSRRDRAVLLPGRDASPKEGLNEDHFLRDDLLEFGIIGCQFERCVHEHAPAALLIGHRSLDDLVKKRADCREWWQLLQAGNPIADSRFKVMSQYPTIQRSLVAEGDEASQSDLPVSKRPNSRLRSGSCAKGSSSSSQGRRAPRRSSIAFLQPVRLRAAGADGWRLN